MSRRSEQVNELIHITPTVLYTVGELAPLLRVSEHTLRRYCKENLFTNAIKVRRKQWLIPGCDVLAFFPHLRRLAS